MRITKRQLLQIINEEKARLREQEEAAAPEAAATVGVEDVSQTEDAFGGGDVEEEIFVDADADALLNQNTDPGEVPTIEVIPERAALKRKLRRLVKEQAGAGAGLPAVDDLAKKLSAAGAEETLSYLRRLMDKVSFGGGDEVEEPALPPELPPADDMVPPDEM
jgi:hypothetical protein